jgi:hypothetical protein
LFKQYINQESRQELKHKLEEITCPSCGKNEWKFTETSYFSGSPSRCTHMPLRCLNGSDCELRDNEFLVQTIGVSKSDFEYMIQNAQCPSCKTQNWEYGDNVINGAERRHTLWNDEEYKTRTPSLEL